MGTNYYINGEHVCKVSGIKPYGTVYWCIHPFNISLMNENALIVSENGREMTLKQFLCYTGGFKWDLSTIDKEFC